MCVKHLRHKQLSKQHLLFDAKHTEIQIKYLGQTRDVHVLLALHKTL